MTLDKLMTRLSEGDKTAFEKIYSLTSKTVYYVALSVVKERSLAEDVMQSVYLNVLKFARQYRKGSNAKAWIARITRNEALNL
ncbi:MAG: RNA polymerase subunit sigma-24, partial [Clostridia bacterium]|nr:RNA polymerase subunit sigma-24 [Clostridia bacterium]